jgi:hypothetical protein
MTLDAKQVIEALNTWLNEHVLKTPVQIKDFVFNGYQKDLTVQVTLDSVVAE